MTDSESVGTSGSEADGAGPAPNEGRTRHVRDASSRWAVLLPAVVGAAVTLVLVLVPFVPILGGAVAGYLRNGTRREGVAVGGLSGLLVALPVGLLGPLVLAVFVPVPPGPIPVRAALTALVVVLLVLLVVAVYFVGLGAVGGMAGVALRERNR